MRLILVSLCDKSDDECSVVYDPRSWIRGMCAEMKCATQQMAEYFECIQCNGDANISEQCGTLLKQIETILV